MSKYSLRNVPVNFLDTQPPSFYKKNCYDLTVNTGYMGIKGAIAEIKAAFAVWKDVHYKEDSATPEK
jgi:hypothetical protein